MADKIVILEDKDGNNIYPITRGMAANSVDTNAIQNGAVTSDKIDWATLTAKTINATTTNTKVQNLSVKLVYNDAGFGIVSGTFKMVGDFVYNERLFSIPGKTSQNSGTVVGTFRNVDFGSSGGDINFTTNTAGTGLNGWNSIIVPVMLD